MNFTLIFFYAPLNERSLPEECFTRYFWDTDYMSIQRILMSLPYHIVAHYIVHEPQPKAYDSSQAPNPAQSVLIINGTYLLDITLHILNNPTFNYFTNF